jgi:hypothetical protein
MNDHARPTDEQILEAIPALSRRTYGREGCGITAEEVAVHLAPEPGTYGVANAAARRHIGRRLAVLARRGLASRGQDGRVPFYRARPA